MRKEYDFKEAKRAQDILALAQLQAQTKPGKVRITMYVDAEVLQAFRERAEQEGKGYQTLMNEALAAAMRPEAAPVTEEKLRRILREEIHVA
jgi:uncharacterized protein (DUF4415 family)